MTQIIILTSCETLGYYVSLPKHFEEAFGCYFENLSKGEQYTLLATLSLYLACYHNFGIIKKGILWNCYVESPGTIENENVKKLIPELEAEENRCNGTISCLLEALVANIRYTRFS